MAVDDFGIEAEHTDALGHAATASAAGRTAILEAMGLAPDSPPTYFADTPWVVKTGHRLPCPVPGVLELEDGSERAVEGEFPSDLPIGYHRFVPRAAAQDEASPGSRFLYVTPGRCYLPDHLRLFGFAAQVYALHSEMSWGIGDLGDLARLGRWAKSLGAGAVMINPLSAPTPVEPIEPSPYYPSSRVFRNPLYLRIEDVPGAAEALGPRLESMAEAGRALTRQPRLLREPVWRLKMQALESIWQATLARGAEARVTLDHFRTSLGPQAAALDRFAAFATLAERHGRDWRTWPAEFRRPQGAAVAALIRDDPRVVFHAWLQALLDEQLARASEASPLIGDLPIGLDLAGADAWAYQDYLASGISVGCPPDEFNADGQDWGLAPFIPHLSRRVGHQPLVETLRLSLRHVAGLRIDHVMGFFRLFWIPRAYGPKAGAYVRYPAEEMLAVADIESHRARAFIVGEDLGNVAEGVRETLAEHAMLSYRLALFESGPPEGFPELALASVTTHDLATLKGIWTREVLAHARRAGVRVNEESFEAQRRRLVALAGLENREDASVETFIEAIHAALARAPSRVVLATMEDALAIAEQPNMPGTVETWPNWSLPLPLSLAEIEAAPFPRRLAELLRRS